MHGSTKHFVATAMAAGLAFCTLFSVRAAADDRQNALQQSAAQANSAYQAESNTLADTKEHQVQAQQEAEALQQQTEAVTAQLGSLYTRTLAAEGALEDARVRESTCSFLKERTKELFNAKHILCFAVQSK